MSRVRVQEEYRRKFEERLFEAYEAGRQQLIKNGHDTLMKEGSRPQDFEDWLELQKDEGPYASEEEFYLEEGIV